VLKYQLILTRTTGKETFENADRQNDRTTNPQTDTLTDNKGRYS